MWLWSFFGKGIVSGIKQKASVPIKNPTTLIKLKDVKKVLLIEDQKDFRESITDMLQFENFKVFTASNGMQGLEIAKKKSPDIILCDIMMPNIDGYEVLKRLKQSNKNFPIPFIFLTALSERDHIRQGMKLGADDYLPKPFTREELLDAISSRLRKYSEMGSYIEHKITGIEDSVTLKLHTLQREVEEKNNSISRVSSQNRLLGQQLKEKELELAKETFNVIEINNTLQDLKNIINKELQNSSLPEDSIQILTALKNRYRKKTVLWNNWTIFQIKFNQTYPDFIKNLTARFPKLTQYEMVFISAHLMGLNTTQLADLLNISDDSVRKSRYRIKKKLGLKKEEDFLEFIHTLNVAS